MKKKGMTLIMLIIYIIVLLILSGISISTVLNNKKAEDITSESYKSIIKGYVDEFTTIKNFYEVKNKTIPSGIIEGTDLITYIPSISLEHTKYLLIQDGEIKYNTSIVSNYPEKEYLEELHNDGILGKYIP